MTPPDEPAVGVDYESPDTVLVEFNDTDHPWEPVPPDELREMLRQINRRNPNAPPEPDTPGT